MDINCPTLTTREIEQVVKLIQSRKNLNQILQVVGGSDLMKQGDVETLFNALCRR